MARPHSLAAVAKDRHSWWRYDRRRSTAICGTAVQRVADETKTEMARPKRSDLHLLLNYLMRYQAVIPAASFRVGRSVGRFIGRFFAARRRSFSFPGSRAIRWAPQMCRMIACEDDVVTV